MSSEGAFSLARALLLAPHGVWQSHSRRARFEQLCARAVVQTLRADDEGLLLEGGRRLLWSELWPSAWVCQLHAPPFAQIDELWLLGLQVEDAEIWVGPFRISTDREGVDAVHALRARGLVPEAPEDHGASDSRSEHGLLALWLLAVGLVTWGILR